MEGDLGIDGERWRAHGLPERGEMGEGEPKLLDTGGRGLIFLSGDASGLTGNGALGGGLEDEGVEREEDGDAFRADVDFDAAAAAAAAAGGKGCMIDTPDGIDNDSAALG